MLIWLLRLVSLAALAGFCAAVWYAGPMVGFGDARPLEPVAIRATIIGVAVGLVALYYGIRFWLARRAQMALEAAIADAEGEGGDASILKARMNDAIATLRRTSRKRNFLYELPWYLVIGPPGAGKTTALVNSGLRFPLAGSSEAQPVSGVGGTRFCDWWFTEDAVIIDTAGRYTTQDSDPDSDKKSWQAFLALLKRNRGRQPINGVILAISLADLMTLDPHSLGAHAIEVKNRLQELHDELKLDYPVYLLFTKADLVLGFMEYFGDFSEERRRKVWGATFQVADRKQNLIGEAPAEMDALGQRLTDEMADRLQEERDPLAQIAIFGFPTQFAALKPLVLDFLGRIFDPSRKQSVANLRGFYFSSGTQEGSPIDQVLGALGRNFGAADMQAQMSGTGKSFFLHDLLSKVIFAESAWVSGNRDAERRDAALRYAGIAAILIAALAVSGVFALSFFNNRQLVQATAQAVDQYQATAGDLLMANTVSNSDLENVIEPLEALRALPVGFDNRFEPATASEGFGYSQRPRLVSAAETAYGAALERMFRTRLLLQLEETIQSNIGNPGAVYDPLKVYLMLGGKAPKVDPNLVVAWMHNDWEKNRYPGAENRSGREELEKHLRAMLELGAARDPKVNLNQPLIESAQRSLSQLTVADRASALIESAAATSGIGDFSVGERAGSEAPLIFETTDGGDATKLRIPALYTYEGFNDFYLTQLAGVAQKVIDDQWVIGGGQLGGVEQELMRLGPEMLDRYSKDFVAAWNGMLDRLKFKPLAADKPDYVALSAAGSPTSPVRQLFEAVANETTLTRPPDTPRQSADDERARGLARIGIQLASGKSQSRAGQAFAKAGETVPGANTEAQFRAFQVLVSGPPARRPIDALIQNFNDIHESLTLTANLPGQTERAGANLQLQISNLRANATRLPKALSRMVMSAADDFEGDAAEASMAQLNEMLKETVTQPCEEIMVDRYPFAGTSQSDMPMEDFARLFAPSGIIDRFFAQNLATLVSMGGTSWDWKQDSQLGKKLSKTSLRKFQQAAEIRDAFFPMGGSIPAVNITFTPFSLHTDADQALLDVNGQIVQSYQTGSSAATVTWPGSLSGGSTALSLTPELPGRDSTLRYEGAWSLKRLFNAASLTKEGENLQARFVIGGRDVAYTVQFSSIGNPFTLPALSEFTCPETL